MQPRKDILPSPLSTLQRATSCTSLFADANAFVVAIEQSFSIDDVKNRIISSFPSAPPFGMVYVNEGSEIQPVFDDGTGAARTSLMAVMINLRSSSRESSS